MSDPGRPSWIRTMESVAGWLRDIGRTLLESKVIKAAAVAALTAYLGPKALEEIRARSDREHLRHELVERILGDTERVDPKDLASLTRLQVVAELIEENPDAFGISFRSTIQRIKALSSELKASPPGLLEQAIARDQEGLKGIDDSRSRLVTDRARLQTEIDRTRQPKNGAEGAGGAAAAGLIAEREDLVRTIDTIALQLDQQSTTLKAQIVTNTEAVQKAFREAKERVQPIGSSPEIAKLRESLLDLERGNVRGVERAKQQSELLAKAVDRLERAEREYGDLTRGFATARKQTTDLQQANRKLLADLVAKRDELAAANQRIKKQDENLLARLPKTSGVEISVDDGRLVLGAKSANSPARLFFTDRDKLTDQAAASVRRMACALVLMPGNDFEIKGSADGSTGNWDPNWDLAARRANAVRKLLQDSGVDPMAMYIAAKVPGEPPPKIKAKAKRNAAALDERRVEVLIHPRPRDALSAVEVSPAPRL